MKWSTCDECPAPPSVSRARLTWARLETVAVRVLSALGLLRAWYGLASAVLRACPPLARLVAPLRPVVLVPSVTGGEVVPVPTRDGRVVPRHTGMAFGADEDGHPTDVHAGDECADGFGASAHPPPVVRRRLRGRWNGRHIEGMVRGWHAVRGGRS